MSSELSSLYSPEALKQMAALASHELRALTIGVMEPGVDYTCRPLYKQIMDLQGENPWPINEASPMGFCHGALRVNMVKRSSEQPISCRIVGLGPTLGHAIAGHAGYLSLTEKWTLSDFFGPTPSNSIYGRPPSQTRIYLMHLLLNSGGTLPIKENAQTLQVYPTSLQRLAGTLRQSGLINYDPEVASGGVLTASDEQLESMSSALHLVRAVAEPTEEFIEDGRHKLKTILTSSDTVRYLIAKAYAKKARQKSAA